MIADSPVLSGLTIGSLTLDPSFDSDVTSYTAETTNATNKITATCDDEEAEIAITVNETEIENEESASWEDGENTVVVTVSKDGQSTSYTVTVTKS